MSLRGQIGRSITEEITITWWNDYQYRPVPEEHAKAKLGLFDGEEDLIQWSVIDPARQAPNVAEWFENILANLFPEKGGDEDLIGAERLDR